MGTFTVYQSNKDITSPNLRSRRPRARECLHLGLMERWQSNYGGTNTRRAAKAACE